MKVLLLALPSGSHRAASFTEPAALAWSEWAPEDELEVLTAPHLGSGLLESVTGCAHYSLIAPGIAVSPNGRVGLVDAAPFLTAREEGTAPLAAALRRAAGHLSVRDGTVWLYAGGAQVLDGGRGLLEELEEGKVSCAVGILAAEQLPLVGLHGAGRRLAAILGDEPAAAQDRAIAEWAARQHGRAVNNLLAGAPRLERHPASGVGGGAGFALLLSGAAVRWAHEWWSEEIGLAEKVARADLAVVLTESLGAEHLSSSAITELGGQTAASALPLVAVTGESPASRRALAAVGICQSYKLDSEPFSPGSVARKVARVARTWSRPGLG